MLSNNPSNKANCYYENTTEDSIDNDWLVGLLANLAWVYAKNHIHSALYKLSFFHQTTNDEENKLNELEQQTQKNN